MKKLFVVLAVLVTFCIFFTAHSFAQSEDPFEIGKQMAMSGRCVIGICVKATTNSFSKFSMSYNSNENSVSFGEQPKSGTGQHVSWTKYFDGPRYINDALDMKDGKFVRHKTREEFEESLKTRLSITQEEAEKEAWRILQYFGYTKKGEMP